MPENNFDVIVVGMGPGGDVMAGRLAEAGLSVLGVDAHLVGGECPYYGCIPSKMMIRAGNALAEARRVPALAGSAQVSADYTPVSRRIRDEATTNWDDQIAVDRFESKGGQFVRGRARLTGPRTIQVGDQEFTASRAVVLNTGTSPVVPPVPGLAETPFWTNRDAVRAEAAPASLVVLGGGAIGVEMAQAFARFGSKVDVVERADRLLALEEPEASQVVAEVLRAEGLGVHTSAGVEAVSHSGSGFTVRLPTGSLRAEHLLVATGRTAHLAELGLDALGVDGGQRFVPTDQRMRVVDGVYAIGDITGKGAFTHMSMYQAGIVERDILGEDPDFTAEYHAVPRVTFTDPEVGAVGLTEAQAREAGLDVRTSVTPMSATTRGWIHGPGGDGLIKLVEDAAAGILVGATSVGPNGGEVLSALTVAVHARVPTDRLRRTIFAYPTFHRGLETAVAELH